MIETVGVMAVIVLLAAIVAENVVSKIKVAKRDSESTSLSNIADALKQSITRNKVVPGPANWHQMAASQLSISLDNVTNTLDDTPRTLLFDPAFRVGTNSSQTVPYTQSRDGSLQPVNARVILISSLQSPLSPITNSSATFSNIWNTPPNGIPAGWPVSWALRSNDLKILRMDWSSLFHHVVLENLDMYHAAPYSVETTNNLTTVPAGGRRDFWLIHSSALNFHGNDNSVQGREYITTDVSYVYENGRWGRYIYYGQNRALGAFGQMVDAFLAAQPPPSPKFYANQQSVVDDMFNLLFYMGLWSQLGFTPDTNPAQPQIPEFRITYDAQDQLSDVSANLIN
jgi:type II secretory pathway pseudopilin PulG